MANENSVVARLWRDFRGPFAATAITLLIIIAGGFGSIFSAEIRRAFPFHWSKGPWSWEAIAFWTAALVAALGYFFRERSQTQAQLRLQRETLAQASHFEKLIRTQPPANFLSVFSAFYGVADSIAEDLLDMPLDQAAIERGARDLLRMIAVLAQKFDGDAVDTVYAANIMLARDPRQMSETERLRVSEILLFSDEILDLEKLHRVLVLEPALSTTGPAADAAPDPDLRSFALAVPAKAKAGTRYKVMPGAPLAFVEGVPDVYEDTADLARWCAEKGDFTHEIIGQVEKHFQASTVKGFLSIPLFARTPESEAAVKTPFAVLNVHCTKPGLLGRGEALRHFYNLIYPFQILLVKLLLARERAGPGRETANPVQFPLPGVSFGMPPSKKARLEVLFRRASDIITRVQTGINEPRTVVTRRGEGHFTVRTDFGQVEASEREAQAGGAGSRPE